jgi:Glycosyl transferase family 2
MSASRAPRRTPWPALPRGAAEGGLPVAVAVATFNTCRLIAQLVFSLYRLLGRDQFSQLIVVDNGSTDGSRELLAALKRADLLHLIQNRTQRYHGPALAQAISSLARGQRSAASPRLEYVWVLDSDVVVVRPDTVRDALALVSGPMLPPSARRSVTRRMTGCSGTTLRCCTPSR